MASINLDTCTVKKKKGLLIWKYDKWKEVLKLQNGTSSIIKHVCA